MVVFPLRPGINTLVQVTKTVIRSIKHSRRYRCPDASSPFRYGRSQHGQSRHLLLVFLLAPRDRLGSLGLWIPMQTLEVWCPPQRIPYASGWKGLDPGCLHPSRLRILGLAPKRIQMLGKVLETGKSTTAPVEYPPEDIVFYAFMISMRIRTSPMFV